MKNNTERFEWPVRVYIEDTDAGGIVYYVNYLKYIERARTEYLRSLGFGRQSIFSQELMFVVKSVNCEYLLPAKLDDQLVATTEIIRVGAAGLSMLQLVERNSELLCRAEVQIVCVNRQTVKPSRIPKDILAALRAQ